MVKNRGFEKLREDIILPTRSTKGSAGYDFYLADKIVIEPSKTICIKTYVKAYMNEDEFLSIHLRSSAAIKKELQLVNLTGIVDSDYYNNKDNEGHIMLFVRNNSNETVVMEANERIAQG